MCASMCLAAAATIAFFVSYALRIALYPLDKIDEVASFIDGNVDASEQEATGELHVVDTPFCYRGSICILQHPSRSLAGLF